MNEDDLIKEMDARLWVWEDDDGLEWAVSLYPPGHTYRYTVTCVDGSYIQVDTEVEPGDLGEIMAGMRTMARMYEDVQMCAGVTPRNCDGCVREPW